MSVTVSSLMERPWKEMSAVTSVTPVRLVIPSGREMPKVTLVFLVISARLMVPMLRVSPRFSRAASLPDTRMVSALS